MTEKFWVELKEKYSVFLQVGLKTFAKTFFDAKKKHAIKLLELGIIDNASTDLHSTEQFKLVEKGLDFILKKFPNLKEQLFSISFES
jgi:tyrosine-protein phosphatase YwqE